MEAHCAMVNSLDRLCKKMYTYRFRSGGMHTIYNISKEKNTHRSLCQKEKS